MIHPWIGRGQKVVPRRIARIWWPVLYGRVGFDAAGNCQARDYYYALVEAERAKALALFALMANAGRIYDTTKFRRETRLYVFKPQPHRFFCFFMKGKRIIIVSAYQKQGRKAPTREIERAERLMGEVLQEARDHEARRKDRK